MNAYDTLVALHTEATHLNSALSLLSWDQETMIPEGGHPLRAQTIAILSGMHHVKMVGEVQDSLKRIEDEGLDKLDEFQRLSYAAIRKDVDRSAKLPKDLVVETGRVCGEALTAWNQAKKARDFSLFAPLLREVVRLRRQEAEHIGYQAHPYDAMLDAYEPGMTAARLQAIFEPFKAELSGLLPQLTDRPQVDDSFLRQPIGADAQLAWGREVIARLGYDLRHGRQDLSSHPFSININPQDVRITTMVNEWDLREMLYSSIHECGHALYEQGLPLAHFGMPAAVACSLGIHESQSRLWENNVGRSLAFWEHFFPQAAALYPDQLRGRTPLDMFRAVNKVGRSLVRINADELTYHFHVLLRFEIELALISGDIEVRDLPAIWNEKVRQYLGLEVTHDAEGVLQDIHWSHGSIGYFPTYSLGSFYAAQLLAAAEAQVPGLQAQFARGEFGQLKAWLNQNIHAHGRLYDSEALCTKATGSPLDVRHFVRYAKEKFGQVYGVAVQ